MRIVRAATRRHAVPIPDGPLYGANVGCSHETGRSGSSSQQRRSRRSRPACPGRRRRRQATMGFSIRGSPSTRGEGGLARCNVSDEGGVAKPAAGATATGRRCSTISIGMLMGLDPAGRRASATTCSQASALRRVPGTDVRRGTTRVVVDAIVSGAGRRVPDASSSLKAALPQRRFSCRVTASSTRK
jgi:hypothetical protein